MQAPSQLSQPLEELLLRNTTNTTPRTTHYNLRCTYTVDHMQKSFSLYLLPLFEWPAMSHFVSQPRWYRAFSQIKNSLFHVSLFWNVFSFICFDWVHTIWICLYGLETQIIYLVSIAYAQTEKKNKAQTLSTGTFCLCLIKHFLFLLMAIQIVSLL